jgi:hypothetical protein
MKIRSTYQISYSVKYSCVIESPLGKKISSFLQSEHMIIAMLVATYLRKPAADGVSPFLLEYFGEDIRKIESQPELYGYTLIFFKRAVGHMIKQIMFSQGYEVEKCPVELPAGRDTLFKYTTRYKKGIE